MEGASSGNFWVVAIAAANMVVSFYYYLRLVKVMFMGEAAEPIEKLSITWETKLSLYVCTVGIVLTGVVGVVYDKLFALISGN